MHVKCAIKACSFASKCPKMTPYKSAKKFKENYPTFAVDNKPYVDTFLAMQHRA